MNKNWEVIMDDKTFEIFKDEETNESCWVFSYCDGEHDGHGVVAKTREQCIKSIIRYYKKELNQLKVELKTKTKNFNKMLNELQGSDEE